MCTKKNSNKKTAIKTQCIFGAMCGQTDWWVEVNTTWFNGLLRALMKSNLAIQTHRSGCQFSIVLRLSPCSPWNSILVPLTQKHSSHWRIWIEFSSREKNHLRMLSLKNLFIPWPNTYKEHTPQLKFILSW